MAGRAQLCIGGADTPGAYINFMKSLGGLPTTTDLPNKFDADGYPIATMTGNPGANIAIPGGFAGNSVSWTILWTGTKVLKFVINQAVTKTATNNATVSGGTNSTMTVTTLGSAGSVTFTFNNFTGPSLSFFFSSGFAHTAGTGELALVRTSDLTAYNAGVLFTPEFIALLQDLNPKTIRPMGWVNTGAANVTNQVQWRYRTTPTSINFNSRYAPGAWGGTVAGTDTYTGSAATDTPGSWTGGEVYQALVTNANTSTTPTLNINSRGAKTITNTQGTALSAGSIAANSLATFVYDDLLDKVLYSPGGISASVPVEHQVNLANTISANLWTVVPAWADDTFVSTWATYIRDNLNSALTFYAEYSNEVWNFAFPQTQWAFQRGLALGFPNANNEPHYGWYGLRSRQIMGAITTLWANAGKTNLKRVLAFQAYGSPSQTNLYRLQGSDLNISLGYTKYNSYVGVSYNSAPNRPIDYCDVLSYAHYYQGASFNDGNGYGSLPVGNIATLQSMATNYATGDTTQLAALDTDVRSGTKSGSISGTQTLADLNTNIYPGWETIAAGYTGKTVEPYEAGMQILAPTTAQCTTMGITVGGSAATASTTLTQLATDYKNSPKYQRIVTDQYAQFLSQAHSQNPSWLQLTGVNQWSLLSGDIFSTPFQTYYAFKLYNSSKRRLVVTT